MLRTPVHVLFDPYSFVNRTAAEWNIPGVHAIWRAIAFVGTCPIMGCVTFNLTFFNELTLNSETLFGVEAKVIARQKLSLGP